MPSVARKQTKPAKKAASDLPKRSLLELIHCAVWSKMLRAISLEKVNTISSIALGVRLIAL
jgi:hypothetical protein